MAAASAAFSCLSAVVSLPCHSLGVSSSSPTWLVIGPPFSGVRRPAYGGRRTPHATDISSLLGSCGSSDAIVAWRRTPMEAPPRQPYPSAVSDDEWAFVAPYLTLMKEDAPQRDHRLREVFNGLRWLVRRGASWRMMPHDLPPWYPIYQQAQR